MNRNSNVLLVNKEQETPGKYFSKEDEVWDRVYLKKNWYTPDY